jgi:hypothetical protein
MLCAGSHFPGAVRKEEPPWWAALSAWGLRKARCVLLTFDAQVVVEGAHGAVGVERQVRGLVDK